MTIGPEEFGQRVRHFVRLEKRHRPRNPQQLWDVVFHMLGFRVPTKPVIPGHSAPFEYLVHAFFDGAAFEGGREAASGGARRDCVVWANRGGGKTQLGAVATLLDLLFKPGIKIRILGGSLEQSQKMYRYLVDLVSPQHVAWSLSDDPTLRRIRLVNTSEVEVLAASHRSVRGTRVHKLRCDEIDELKKDVWDAAQAVPRSARCGPVEVRGSIEAMSTMRLPYGQMSRVIDGRRSARLIRWCALDVIERCPPQRSCPDCNLWPYCQGRAKEADGFMSVDDVVAMRDRLGDDDWFAEMMCQRPKRSSSVYARFDPTPGGRHVVLEMSPPAAGDTLVGGMDFGIVGEHAMLWARVLPGPIDPMLRVVEVFDEYVVKYRTLEENLDAMSAHQPAPLAWVGVDPAGQSRNQQTGMTNVDVLRRRGYAVRFTASRLEDGIQRIRRRLDRGTLRVSARCTALVRALTDYHFDPQQPNNPNPVKDGPDHACDALRYLIVNLELNAGVVDVRGY